MCHVETITGSSFAITAHRNTLLNTHTYNTTEQLIWTLITRAVALFLHTPLAYLTSTEGLFAVEQSMKWRKLLNQDSWRSSCLQHGPVYQRSHSALNKQHSVVRTAGWTLKYAESALGKQTSQRTIHESFVTLFAGSVASRKDYKNVRIYIYVYLNILTMLL